MPECLYIKPKVKKYCLGSLSSKIQLIRRVIDVDNSSSVDYGITKTTISTVWASIETIKSIARFSDINIEDLPTHKFTIKYLAGMDKDVTVSYNSKYFRVLTIENVDEENQWLVLHCTERGTTTKQANEV